MKELGPGLFQIETEMGDNHLFLYLLHGQKTMLIDSGVRATPDTMIYPALAAAGLPQQIDLLLISHADADHHGGQRGYSGTLAAGHHHGPRAGSAPH